MAIPLGQPASQKGQSNFLASGAHHTFFSPCPSPIVRYFRRHTHSACGFAWAGLFFFLFALPVSAFRGASPGKLLLPTPKSSFLSLFLSPGLTSTHGYPHPTHAIPHLQPHVTGPSAFPDDPERQWLLLYHSYVVVLSDIPHSHNPPIPYTRTVVHDAAKHQGMRSWSSTRATAECIAVFVFSASFFLFSRPLPPVCPIPAHTLSWPQSQRRYAKPNHNPRRTSNNL